MVMNGANGDFRESADCDAHRPPTSAAGRRRAQSIWLSMNALLLFPRTFQGFDEGLGFAEWSTRQGNLSEGRGSAWRRCVRRGAASGFQGSSSEDCPIRDLRSSPDDP